ncbi:MAG: flippase [Patescibacteria group bacterium]
MANSKLGKFLLDNTTTSQTIAKNTFWLSFGEITGRLLRVGLIFYAARVLGAAGYGVFSYMTSLAGILTIFADLGLSGILIREGAKSEELRKTYFATSLFIKLIIVTGSFVVIILVAPLITDIPLSRTLIYAVGLLIVFDSLRGFGNAIFRAEEQMQYEAGTSILTQIIIVAGGIYTLTFTPSPESLAISYATGSAVGLIIVSYLVRKYIRGVFKFFRKDLIVKILTAGWPIGFAAIFGGLLVNIDTVMIGWFLDADHVGYYAAAQKPIAFFYILPAFIVGSLFPVMARYAKSNKDKFREVMERGISTTILLACPLVAGIVFNAHIIVGIVYGSEFLSAVLPLSILALSLLVTFPNTILVNAIFAYNRQREMISAWIIGSLLNVSLNFLLIPILDLLGAAITSLFTQLLIFAFFWHKMQKINNFSMFRHTTSIIKATCLMILWMLVLKAFGLPFTLVVLASIFIYFGSLVLFKDPTLKESLAVINRHDIKH